MTTNLPDRMAAEALRLISLTPVEIRRRLWICVGFERADEDLGDAPHLAMLYAERDWRKDADLHAAVTETFSGADGLLARVHSECILGEAFGSTMCDCGDQLRLSMEEMVSVGLGALIYLRQEGRGIGLRNKLDVLALQYGFAEGRKGSQTYTSDEANLALGHPVDAREYGLAASLFRALGVGSVQLISGNPQKIDALKAGGVPVASAVDLWRSDVSPRALRELREKIARGYTYQRENLSNGASANGG